jgi:hypothetical protein
MRRFNQPSDDGDEIAVNPALNMNKKEIDSHFNNIRFHAYAPTEEIAAEYSQKQDALAQLHYMRWLASAPTAAEIAATQAILALTEIES